MLKMPPLKKSAPSKFLTEDLDDFLTDSEFLNGSPKKTKLHKRKEDNVGRVEHLNMNDTNSCSAKKKKINENIEVSGESRQKTLNVMNRLLDDRKQVNEKMLKNLSHIIEDFEGDYNALKENEQKLELLIGSFMKCMQQSATAYKQKLKMFKELHATFKKRYEDSDMEQRVEMDKLGGELEECISKLKQKLIAETKRSERENLQKYFMKAMQNNF